MMRKMIMIMSWWRTSWWSVEQIHVKVSPSLKMNCWTPPKMLLVEHKFPNGSGRDRQNLSRCFLQRGPTKKLSIPLPMSAFVIAGRFVLIFSTSHPFQCHHATMPPVPSFCDEGLPLLGMVNFIAPVVVDRIAQREMQYVDPAKAAVRFGNTKKRFIAGFDKLLKIVLKNSTVSIWISCATDLTLEYPHKSANISWYSKQYDIERNRFYF